MIVCSIAQSCLILCDPMDCSLPGSSGHGIFQGRILEWVAISFSKGSSWPRDQTPVSCMDRWILYYCTTWEAHLQPTLQKYHTVVKVALILEHVNPFWLENSIFHIVLMPYEKHFFLSFGRDNYWFFSPLFDCVENIHVAISVVRLCG